MSNVPERLLLTIPEAAYALGCSKKHIKRLISEADANRRSRWRWNRELIDLATRGSSRRMIRINVAAIVPPLSPP
jgi:RNase P subunit RPR2